MKHLFLLSTLLFIFTSGFSQRNIEEIRAEFRLTEGNAELKEKHFEYECPDYPEAGDVTFSSDRTGIRKIVFSHGWEHGNYTNSYYLKDGNLYFAYVVLGTWYFDAEEEGKTWDEVTENRLYFVNEEPIKCLYKNFRYRSDQTSPSATTPNDEVECDEQLLKMIEEELVFLAKLYELDEISDCPREYED